MSGRRIYLHIGAPKTGTTYLQDRLELNARTLAAHGVHFPSRNAVTAPTLAQFRAALDLLGQDWGGPPGHADGAWDALARRVRRLSGTVVISHEILAPAEPEQVARAKASLTGTGAELHIVYSVRDHARQLPAAWQESVKQGRTWTYRRFLRRATMIDTWFAKAFDLPTVLGTWGAGLPPERVHLVTVPHQRGPELWQRYCRVFGIDAAWVPRDSAVVNASLGVAETTMLRKLNRRMGRTTRREPGIDLTIRRLLADGRLMRTTSPTLHLPPRLHPWAVDHGQRWVDWVQSSGFDVVGDLDDLLPGPPVAQEEFVHPDRVGTKRQLAAALGALAAMTEEAARRPDPDAALGARVRNQVRQMRRP